MNEIDRKLLLTGLCARLPYGVMCQIGELAPLQLESVGVSDIDGCILNFGKDGLGNLYDFYLSEVKPYLRPMSSMTEEETEIFNSDFGGIDTEDSYNCIEVKRLDWLNAQHFDYRGLIEKGLAIAVTEENNPYK